MWQCCYVVYVAMWFMWNCRYVELVLCGIVSNGIVELLSVKLGFDEWYKDVAPLRHPEVEKGELPQAPQAPKAQEEGRVHGRKHWAPPGTQCCNPGPPCWPTSPTQRPKEQCPSGQCPAGQRPAGRRPAVTRRRAAQGDRRQRTQKDHSGEEAGAWHGPWVVDPRQETEERQQVISLNRSYQIKNHSHCRIKSAVIL